MRDSVPYSYEWPRGHPVVTIDIGTSRSACSITQVGSEITAQELINPQGSAYRNSHHKVETALLLRPVDSLLDPSTTPTFTSANDVESVAFGDQAETVYGDMDASERGNYIFCRHFKLLLLEEEEEPIVSSTTGGFSVSLQVVFTKVMEIYRQTAINHLRKSIRSDLNPADVLWVLTVPAIWTERNKRSMRMAAFDAGLITDVDDRALLLCLEPEGVCFAALQQSMLPICRGATQSATAINITYDLCDDEEDFLDVEEVLKDEVREQECDIGQVISDRGSKFLVLDAGGGTVDISAYEVTSAHNVKLFKVKQLAAPTGGEFGGTQVDKQFMLLLRDIIGEEPFQALTDRYRHVELEIRRAWETVKVNAKRDPAEAAPAVIQLASLQQEVLAPLGLKLADLIAAYRADRLAAGTASQLCPEAKGDTRMVLPTDLIASLFEPSISKTIECLDKYLTTTRAGEATHLLMAGGYSACPFLWDAVLGHISRLRGDNGERTLTSMHKVTTHPLNASSLMRSLTDFLTPSFTLTPQCMGCTLTNAMRALIYFLTPSFFPPISSVGQQSRYGHCTWSGDIRDRAPRQGGESHREMHLRRGSSGAFQPSQPGPSETNRECGSGSPWTALSACVRKTLDCWSECACRVHF